MENNREIIPVFFAVDDVYSSCLAVALQSLIDNSSKKYFYSIKILYTNISDENKKKISKYKDENIDIEFVDLNYYIDKVSDKLYTRDYYTNTTYFRLFMPDLYPNYKKALYLDSDIVVLGDISELYNIDLGDNLIGAIPDGIIQNYKEFQDYSEKVVGVSDYKNYFNAGILVMNLEELIKFHFLDKFLYLLGTIKFAIAQDQDYLNRLCKGRVKLIDYSWDVMPIPEAKQIPEDKIKIVHYNMIYKPWHSDNIIYEKYFWKYAKKTEYYDELRKMKDKYTEKLRFHDLEMLKNLKDLAIKESSCVGDDRIQEKRNSFTKYLNLNTYKEFLENREIRVTRGNKTTIEKAPDRIEVIQKIEDFEKGGIFDVDPENDPPTITLNPEDIDYVKKGYTKKIKTSVANQLGKEFLKSIIKKEKLIIKQVNGRENLKSVQGGAMITCNHFNPYDSFAIEKVCLEDGILKHRKLYKVIREGNYTSSRGLYKIFFRNCDTLPLSSNVRTMIKFMKAVEYILAKGDFILIYPEQSMWWNYRKPKPLKSGAFKIAVRNNVPIIPIFITMEDSDKIGKDGFPIQQYTINIEKPIYPDPNLSEKENSENMKNKNFGVWKKIYENFYHTKLKYTTINVKVDKNKIVSENDNYENLNKINIDLKTNLKMIKGKKSANE